MNKFSSTAFVMHSRAGWEVLSASEANPLWLRIACLAFARCQPNGHTPLARGVLALAMSDRDPETGLPVLADRRTLHDAIRNAVAKGWLRPGSSARCLVVPVWVTYVKGGVKAMNSPCSWCGRRQS